MATRNENVQFQAIKDFWRWFTTNTESLLALYQGDQFEELGRQISNELDKIEPQLAWEMGPGKKEENLLTISAEGNPTLRSLADRVIQLAPPLKGWEFYSSRPARPAAAEVRLPESGESFETAHWEFVPVEHASTGRLDLIIVDDQLARSDREAALKAVSIYLDELLGEDVVEKWIGDFEVKNGLAAHSKTTYKIAELPEYLHWATNRTRNPLTKHDVQ